jgi:hypothetical protein
VPLQNEALTRDEEWDGGFSVRQSRDPYPTPVLQPRTALLRFFLFKKTKKIRSVEAYLSYQPGV